MHRDLKPENILVGFDDDELTKIYIVDYGISKFFRDGQGNHMYLFFSYYFKVLRRMESLLLELQGTLRSMHIKALSLQELMILNQLFIS